MVHRQVEEALDGVLVQVDGDDVVHPGGSQQVGDQLGGDGLARGRLAVLARVAVMGDDGRHGAGRGALRGVHHDEQLHERIVHVVADGTAHRLDEEHVGAADALLVARVNLAVRELLKLDVAERRVQVLRDLLGKLGVDRPREQGHALLHFRHVRAPSFHPGAAAPRSRRPLSHGHYCIRRQHARTGATWPSSQIDRKEGVGGERARTPEPPPRAKGLSARSCLPRSGFAAPAWSARPPSRRRCGCGFSPC